jgi:hypothetical protein
VNARRLRKWIVRGAIGALFFYTPIASVNPASRLALIDSLLSRGTPATEDSRFFNRLDMVFEDGHFYSDKPPLLALYSTAVIAPVHGPLTFDRDPAGKILYWLVVASASGLALLILVLATRSMHNRAGGSVPWPWLAAGIVAATCVLPFARTYNDHIMEAAALLVAFALLRGGAQSPGLRRPLAIGALIGLAWLLHPLVGSVTAVTTGLYYLLRGRGTFGRRILLASVFSAGTLGTIALGTAVHAGLYDRAAPFYFSPELYLWTDGPGGVESHWLSEPTVPGLTAQRIMERFEDLGIPEERLEDTLYLFEAHSESVRNPIRFALQRLFRYGQLTFTPLVLFCLLLAVASIRRERGKYRAETLWALVSVAGLVVASIGLRAVPGGSFGDRHLLPAVPLLVTAGGLAAVTAREGWLFLALALLSMTIVVPGALAPWVTPGDTFLAVNLGITSVAVLGAVLVWRSAEESATGRVWSRLEAAFTERRVFVLVAGFAVLQVLLYLGTLPAA